MCEDYPCCGHGSDGCESEDQASRDDYYYRQAQRALDDDYYFDQP